MKLDLVKEFVKSKKGKAMIAAAIGAAVLHFFPESKDAVAQWADVIAEVLTGVADKVDPASVPAVAQ